MNKATRAGLDQQLSVLSDGSLALARARLHEFYVAGGQHDGAGLGLAVLLAARIGGEAPILWLRLGDRRRQRLAPYGPGLAELGVDPGRLILVEAKDAQALLRAAGDAARCGGLGALLVEARGKWPALDLTTSRRLLLAAERSGVTVLLARSVAVPLPSAAETRWQVEAAPSRPTAAGEPGRPAFIVELLRRRGGPAGSRWRLEWNREQASFRETPLPGAVVPLPARRAAADRAGEGAMSPVRSAA